MGPSLINSKWRLMQSGHNDARTNMAVDEALFLRYAEGKSAPTLRIYGWQPRAFSLGYFQDAGKTLDLTKCVRDRVAFVRRITGGGAIFHNRELTYSLVCSKQDIGACGLVLNSFKHICSFIINAYRELGLKPEFAVETAVGHFKERPRGVGASFCFASREKYDILINNKKIGGNAQKRRKDIIFQHGSIPLSPDIDTAFLYLINKPQGLKDKVCSLEEALDREVGFEEAQEALVVSFQKTFSVDLKKEDLSPEEKELSEKLKQEKYLRREWNLDRENAYPCQKAALAE